MLVMVTGNLVGFVIGTDAMRYLAEEFFGTWAGTYSHSTSPMSYMLANADFRLAVPRGGVRGVVYRCAIHV
jgi:hypothetical protein